MCPFYGSKINPCKRYSHDPFYQHCEAMYIALLRFHLGMDGVRFRAQFFGVPVDFANSKKYDELVSVSLRENYVKEDNSANGNSTYG